MSSVLDQLVNKPYEHGFRTEIESETAPKGLSEDTIRMISAKKNEPEWLLEFRLKAYRHWLTMEEPRWPNVHYPKIDFQDINYYSAPKPKKKKSMDEVDPELLRTFEKLGVPMNERAALAGVAVDVIFDSVSVATTYKEKLAEGRHHLLLDLGSGARTIPSSCGSTWAASCRRATTITRRSIRRCSPTARSCFIPKGVKCPMELSTYFRINTEESGQFERTLIIAEEGASVSYLEGCTAPKFDTNQLHAAVVELVALDRADIKYSTVQNWYAGRRERRRRHLQLRHQARPVQRREFEDLVDAGRDRLGDHLEISVVRAARRQLDRRVLFGRADQPLPAGRYRHEDDPHRQEHPQHDHQQRHLGRAARTTAIAGS